MSLGETLRNKRREADLSLEGLSRESEVSFGYLSRVERDRQIPARDRFLEIAKALTTDLDEQQQLVDQRDVTELAERFNLEIGVAQTAVKLNRSEPDADGIRAALENLDPQKRQMLYESLLAVLEQGAE